VANLQGKTYSEKLASFRAWQRRQPRIKRKSRAERREAELDAFLRDLATDREWAFRFRRVAKRRPDVKGMLQSTWPAFAAAIRKWGPPRVSWRA